MPIVVALRFTFLFTGLGIRGLLLGLGFGGAGFRLLGGQGFMLQGSGYSEPRAVADRPDALSLFWWPAYRRIRERTWVERDAIFQIFPGGALGCPFELEIRGSRDLKSRA